MADLWSYSTGRRGVSRVRVYERYPDSPIHVEFTDGKRQTLSNVTGRPIFDRNLAVQVANRMSEKLEAGHKKKNARELLGFPEKHTLGELLKRYHEDKEPGWSEKHTSTQRSIRDWWLERLGSDTNLRQIDDPMVERTVRLYGDQQEWSKRTRQKYLRYLMAAFRYARRKLKWIGEAEDLTAVDVPTPESGGPSYTRKQMWRMLQSANEVDWRVDLALHIAYDTQARSKTLRYLRHDDYLGGRLIRLDAKDDKARTERKAALTPTTVQKLKAVMRRPEVEKSGWLFPDPDDAKQPITYDKLLGLLEEVEASAGVPKMKHRGWESVKRRAVKDAEEAPQRRT